MTRPFLAILLLFGLCQTDVCLANSSKENDKLNLIEKLDSRVRSFSKAHTSKTSDRVFDVVRWFGDWKLYVGLSAAFTAAGENEFGELSFKGGIISGVAKESLLYVVGRERPRHSDRPDTYRSGGKSFPSGHSTTAFALATSFDETYGIGYITYPLATLTALSRVYHDGHWASDILMGAGLGIASVKAIAIHDEERIDFKESSGIYAKAIGAYTLADLVTRRFTNTPTKVLIKAGVIGFLASEIDQEADIYSAFAGVATSLLFTHGLKKWKSLRVSPNALSLTWRW